MKPLLLIAALLGILAMVLLAADLRLGNRDDPQVVPLPAGDMLVVSFAHADHLEQNCVDCHHNFVDDSGTGMCFDCHKTQAEVAPHIEEQFHDLCRGCHIEKQAAGADHGPTRQCISCHVRDDRP